MDAAAELPWMGSQRVYGSLNTACAELRLLDILKCREKKYD